MVTLDRNLIMIMIGRAVTNTKAGIGKAEERVPGRQPYRCPHCGGSLYRKMAARMTQVDNCQLPRQLNVCRIMAST